MAFLRCSAGCDGTLDLHARNLACPVCGGLLEVAIDKPALEPEALRQTWLERRMSRHPVDASGVWRFRELLPGDYAPENVVTMPEGNIPLVQARRSAAWADVENLWFKHLGWNPTGSFKDLGMTAGMTEAKFAGARVVACASTGNTAASLAAYAARAGIRGRVYLPAGQASQNKLAQALDYGAEMVEVEGSFDDALETLLAADDPSLYFLNSINPFRIEGQKTAMFELMEQWGWQAPDYVFVPGGNLGNSSAFGKAFREMREFGLLDRVPKMIVVQAAGANPLAQLWTRGEGELVPVARPETAATAIRIGNPRSWRKALAAVHATGGCVLDVTDDEIREAKAAIGADGIGCEPASATTLAGIRRMRSDGTLERGANIVAVLTGHVLKDTDYIVKNRLAGLRHEAATIPA